MIEALAARGVQAVFHYVPLHHASTVRRVIGAVYEAFGATAPAATRP